MDRKTLNSAFLLFLRFFVGFVFAYAGTVKLLEPVENFRGALAEYEIIPYAWVPWIAYAMPWIELLAGIFLILGFATRASAFVTGVLSLSFVCLFLLTRALTGTVPASCGCFGQGGIRLTVNQMLLFDTFNFLAALRLFLMTRHPFSLDAKLSR